MPLHSLFSTLCAYNALEVIGELALVRETGVRRDLCQRKIAVWVQELLLRPFYSRAMTYWYGGNPVAALNCRAK
jgi:hypothetical protein